ncbi:MAG: TfoX/Sxy family protein [Thermoplasmatota archaeon]
MAYDEGLAERLRERLPEAREKEMFGGVAFMERGNLVAGVHGDELIARVGPKQLALAQRPGARPFAVGGRPMGGWILVAPEAVAEDSDLDEWLASCRAFTDTLPDK